MKNIMIICIACLQVVAATSQAQSYRITFYAKAASGFSDGDSFLGHVWVGFKTPNGKEERIGFYPEGLQSEPYASLNYTFTVTREGFYTAKEIIGVYNDNAYILGVNDCRSFAEEVAKAAGLKIPNTSKAISPSNWLSALVEAN